MGTTDLYVEGFPHGTPEGFDRGCRGKSSCPNATSDELTCVDVYGLVRSDYQFRRLYEKDPAAARSRNWQALAVAAVKPAVPKPSPPVELPLSTVVPSDETTGEQPVTVVEPRPEEEPDTAMPVDVEPPLTLDTPPGSETSAPPSAEPFPTDNASIRAWAAAHGVDVNPRGSVRTDVRERYLAAMNDPSSSPAPDPVDTEPAATGSADEAAAASETLSEHFTSCGCHDSWDQCPCAEGGHPADGSCQCCPLGTGLCGPKPSAVAEASFDFVAEGLRDYSGTPAPSTEGHVPLTAERSVSILMNELADANLKLATERVKVEDLEHAAARLLEERDVALQLVERLGEDLKARTDDLKAPGEDHATTYATVHARPARRVERVRFAAHVDAIAAAQLLADVAGVDLSTPQIPAGRLRIVLGARGHDGLRSLRITRGRDPRTDGTDER